MNETINLPRLIALVAERANVQPAEARKFLHELFVAVETALVEGESVKIKGVGEFVRGEDSASPVLFKADDELASLANEPFAAFEAVELNDGATEEIMKVGETPTKQVVEAPSPIPSSIPNPEPDPEIAAVDEVPEVIPDEHISPAPDAIEEKESEEEAVEETRVTEDENIADEEKDAVMYSEPTTEPEVEESVENPVEGAAVQPEERIVYVQQPSSHGMWLMLGILLGLIAGLVGGYFAGKYMAQYELPSEEDMVFDEDTLSVSSIFAPFTDTVPAVEPAATATPAPEQQPAANEAPVQTVATATPSPAASKAEPVYDTISGKRYLAIIAREHYGVKNYWIFIYNANPNLGDPNKIAPGTKVLIPAKESFMEATKAETDAKASRLLNELSKKYKL